MRLKFALFNPFSFTSFLLILLFSGVSAIAQTKIHRWAIGAMGGTNQYSGDLGNRVFAFDQAAYGFGGVSFGRWLNPSLNLTVQGTYGAFGYSNKVQNYAGHKIDFDLLFSLKFNNGVFLPKAHPIEPFLMAGIGTAGYRGSEIPYVTREGYRVNDIIIPLGAGVKYQVNERWAIQYYFLYKLTDHDVRDRYVPHAETNGQQDHYGQQNLGLIYVLGKIIPDGDVDGVPDKRDMCPYTPPGVPVDSLGCPFDTDKDGVYDYADKCAGIVGKASAAGCPDKDEDGVSDKEDLCPDIRGRSGMQGCPDADDDKVTDKEDACPDKAGVLKFKGCPDSDQDGIQDSEDDCPYRAGAASLKGCPDMDEDFVPDHLDNCPGLPGTQDTKGCPDRDGDGLHDLVDRCPDKLGKKEYRGCPELPTEVKSILDNALRGVQFETGKAVLKSESFPILNQVVDLMNNNPEYLLILEGHTDNSGDREKNKSLSQWRAEAVKIYLGLKGISESRISANGYGSEKPVGDNATAEGRALNRRVEFKIEY